MEVVEILDYNFLDSNLLATSDLELGYSQSLSEWAYRQNHLPWTENWTKNNYASEKWQLFDGIDLWESIKKSVLKMRDYL